MTKRTCRIDRNRLRRSFDAANAFGFNPDTGGFNRPGFSNADMEIRRWFAEVLRSDGLNTWTDGAGNVFGRYGPVDGPCVMAGSHLDTVPEGGAFDGVLGVCAALECVRAIRSAGLRPRIAIEIVATSEEEGRFGGMLGSQAMTGQASAAWIESAVDAQGTTLVEAMQAQGLAQSAILTSARQPDDVTAFLELHVEQGPVLEAAGIPVGVATSVSGVCNLFVRLLGRANHSGTTPMALRADAFAGLAQAATAIPEIIRLSGSEDGRVTIGQVDLHPNFPHTVPGRAEFSVIIRDTDEAAMRAMRAAVTTAVEQAAQDHGLTAEFDERSWLAPVSLDPGLAALLQEEARALGLPAHVMASGAGHDAQTMQALCPSALIFVPSRDGVSHAPEEWTDWNDIEKGAELMLAALVRLSGAA